MLEDLKQMFKEYNKKAKFEALLYNTKFNISLKNSQKIFNEFLTRFIEIIAFISLFNK